MQFWDTERVRAAENSRSAREMCTVGWHRRIVAVVPIAASASRSVWGGSAPTLPGHLGTGATRGGRRGPLVTSMQIGYQRMEGGRWEPSRIAGRSLILWTIRRHLRRCEAIW
jgi:hypothetical protein